MTLVVRYLQQLVGNERLREREASAVAHDGVGFHVWVLLLHLYHLTLRRRADSEHYLYLRALLEAVVIVLVRMAQLFGRHEESFVGWHRPELSEVTFYHLAP